MKLPKTVFVRVEGEREPFLNTEVSLDDFDIEGPSGGIIGVYELKETRDLRRVIQTRKRGRGLGSKLGSKGAQWK